MDIFDRPKRRSFSVALKSCTGTTKFFYYEKGLSNDLGGLSFGQDSDGNWGYKIGGADTVHPFKSKITMFFKFGNTPPNLAGGSREVRAGIINSSDYQKAVVKLSSHSLTSNSLTLRIGDIIRPIQTNGNAQEFDISNSKNKNVDVVLVIPAQSNINVTGTVEFS